MKRALLLALPLLALGPAGCTTDNLASLSIHGICAPPTSCTFSGTCDAFALSVPAIDPTVAVNGRLTLALEVANQLASNASPDTSRTNTHDAHVDEIRVRYEGISLPSQVLGTNQYVPTAGTAVIAMDVIPSALNAAATLAAYAPTVAPREMTAVVRLGGYYDDGSRFLTGDFPIAVQVCSGCIPVACAGGATCPPNSEGQLPLACQ